MEPIAQGRGIGYAYEGEDCAAPALDGVDFTLAPGELLAVLGSNGSGKTTLVRHLNALLPLQRGELTVAGIDVRQRPEIWKLRRRCGMVFQNPDNQFVSAVVADDIAFGLENYEVPREEIPRRVSEALRAVGAQELAQRDTATLSGGQKQRVAVAGVLALRPDIVVFDEATSMLDPQGRGQLLALIRQLHGQTRAALVTITHYAEEAVMADRVLLMHAGRLLCDGTPRRVLTDPALLARAGLLPPAPVRLFNGLRAAGVELPECPLTDEELVEEICRWHAKKSAILTGTARG